MDSCEKCNDFLAGFLGTPEKSVFVAHLKECADCREKVSESKCLDAGLREALMVRSNFAISQNAKHQLVTAAIAKQRGLRSRGRVWQLGLAAAVLLAVIGGYWIMPQNGVQGEMRRDGFVEVPPVHVPNRSGSIVDIVEVLVNENATVFMEAELDLPSLKVAGNGRLVARAAGARLGLGNKSHVEIVSGKKNNASFVLKSGTCAFDVAPRTENGRFTVRAGNLDVVVVGTVFQVTTLANNGVRVAVLEGTVRLFGGDLNGREVASGEVVEVAAGMPIFGSVTAKQTRQLATLLEIEAGDDVSAEEQTGEDERESKGDKGIRERTVSDLSGPHASAFDISGARAAVISGRFLEAMQLLNTRLSVKPDDTVALSLKGDCLRKMGQWRKAVGAYSKVAKLAGPRRANRARLSAAVLLQDRLGNHKEAKRYLVHYLAQSKSFRSMEAEVMYRLGRSYLALGEKKRARGLLQKVSHQHGGTVAAVGARRLLKNEKNFL